jgi:hypothetical protein
MADLDPGLGGDTGAVAVRVTDVGKEQSRGAIDARQGLRRNEIDTFECG